MNPAPQATSRLEQAKPKSLGLKALRPGHLQDPLLDGPVKNGPIPIYY